MKVVLQRVQSSSVVIDGKTVGEIGKGLMLLVGITHDDTEKDVKYLVDKLIHLRIFEDEEGKMNLSLIDVGGQILSISQFTLYGDTRKGRRPGFSEAARPEVASKLYDLFNQEIAHLGVHVETGEFGADMAVSLVNDGPVTLIVESRKDQ